MSQSHLDELQKNNVYVWGGLQEVALVYDLKTCPSAGMFLACVLSYLFVEYLFSYL